MLKLRLARRPSLNALVEELRIRKESSDLFNDRALPALKATDVKEEEPRKFVRKCTIPISDRKSSLPTLNIKGGKRIPPDRRRSSSENSLLALPAVSRSSSRNRKPKSEKMASALTLPSHMSGFLHELGNGGTGVYSYVSYPSAILPNRPKYRQPSVNIMRDKRVVRGNTYSLKANVTPTEDAFFRQRQAEKRGYLRKKILPDIKGQKSLNSSGNSSRRSSPPNRDIKTTLNRSRARKRFQDRPPDGRKHCDIQTDGWLEEIKDRPSELEVGIQTSIEEMDSVSRPVTPALAYQPSGIDKSTQILPDDPELFVFDEEVTIVLEALVGKTLEQSLLEVLEEEELAAITQQKLNFQSKKIVARYS